MGMKDKRFKAVSNVYIFLVFLFLYLPIMVLIAFSFNQSRMNIVWTGFTLKWYSSLVHNTGILEALKNSFIVAIISTIISVVIGTLASIGMYRFKFRGMSLIDTVLYLPLVIPEIVMGISLLAFFSIVHIPLGRISLIIAHVTFCIAYVVAVVKTRLDGFDRSVEEASMDLGATPLKTFFHVTLPIIMPGVIAGGLLAFTLSLDDVIISFFVAGPGSVTLPLKIFSMVKFGVTPEINALSTIVILFTVIAILISLLLRNVNMNMKRVTAVLVAIFLIAGGLGGGIFAIANANKGPTEELNVFNWSEYLPQSVIDKFEQTYNIKVNYNTFSSNEEMLAKIMAGGGKYDIAVASDFMVEILKKQKLIREIDKSELPNLKNIGSQFLNLPFDQGNHYSVPYMWLAGIIAYDSSKVKPGTITGYKDLWKKEFKNSLTVLDDERVMIGITMKMLGYPLNETSPIALEKAKTALKELQANIKSYDSDSPKTSLINGEAKAIFAWGAEASLAHRENPHVKYVLPKEGLFLQQDNLVIPKDAKNLKAAELFMNFIMEPEISAEISHYFPYGNPNTAAYPYIDKKIMSDEAVYPPETNLKTGEYLKDIGSAVTKLDKIWSEVKQ